MQGLQITGNPYHVNMIRSIIEHDPECKQLASELRGLYRIGGGAKIMAPSTWLRALSRNTVLHWIGTDVFDFVNNNTLFKSLSIMSLNKNALAHYARHILLKRMFHFAGAPWLAEELKSVGIPARYVPLPLKLPETEIKPLPNNPAIVVYLPEGRESFYGWDQISMAAKAFPDIKWHVIANSGRGIQAPYNVKFHGWISRDAVIDLLSKSTALVRLVDHDGLSYSVLEALSLGRYVIWNYKFPFCIFCNKTTSELTLAIAELLRHKKPNRNASSYIKETFEARRVTIQLLRTMKELQK